MIAMGLRSQKNNFFGKYLSPERKYPTDNVDLLGKFPTREKARISANITPIDYDSAFSQDIHGMSDLGDDRVRSTAMRLFSNVSDLSVLNTGMNSNTIQKYADDSVTPGMLVGGAAGVASGAGIAAIGSELAARHLSKKITEGASKAGFSGYEKWAPLTKKVTSKALMKAPISLFTDPSVFTKHPDKLSLFQKAFKKIPVSAIPIGIMGGVGAVAGGLASKITNRGNQQVYQDPYSMYKYGSEEHAFISDTNVQPLPGHTVPDDIEDAVQMEHPALKYLPLVSGLSGIIAGGVIKKGIRKMSPTLNDAMLHGFLGAAGGSIAKRELERKYSHPYMEKFVETVDSKYLKKESSDTPVTQEYISETGVPILEKKNFPKNIESAVTFKHQYVDVVPTLATAAGMVLGHKIKGGVPGVVGGAAVGSLIGTAGRMMLVDHYSDPYREAFIKEVKNKYGLS